MVSVVQTSSSNCLRLARERNNFFSSYPRRNELSYYEPSSGKLTKGFRRFIVLMNGAGRPEHRGRKDAVRILKQSGMEASVCGVGRRDTTVGATQAFVSSSFP
ncbi:hypothetical protein CBL_08677 [Carabus blaptoides fortunei]